MFRIISLCLRELLSEMLATTQSTALRFKDDFKMIKHLGVQILFLQRQLKCVELLDQRSCQSKMLALCVSANC